MMSVLAHNAACEQLGFGLHELEVLYRYVKEMNRMNQGPQRQNGLFPRDLRLDHLEFEDLLRQECENRRKKVREVFENGKV